MGRFNEKDLTMYTILPYDYDTDEVSTREILKFVEEELNKDNYFILEGDDDAIYLKWRTDGRRFATVYVDRVVEIIKHIKEEKRNGRL